MAGKYGIDMNFSKSCERCEGLFYKNKRDSKKQWDQRQFCSIACNNSSRPIKPISERFWSKVRVRVKNVCWEWTGSCDEKGYGNMSSVSLGAPLKAYRVSWEIHFGSIPAGLSVLHACDNPRCVNPNHLMLGTQMANTVDMARKNRINSESLLNLRPGQQGIYGAGLVSNKEMQNGINQ